MDFFFELLTNDLPNIEKALHLCHITLTFMGYLKINVHSVSCTAVNPDTVFQPMKKEMPFVNMLKLDVIILSTFCRTDTRLQKGNCCHWM